MTLEDGYGLYKDIELLKDAIHTTGLLKVRSEIEGNLLYITVENKVLNTNIEKEIARFLMKNLIQHFKQFAKTFNYGSFVVRPILSVLNHEETLVITYQFSKDDTLYHHEWMFFDLVKAVVFAVEDAKVEYCLAIQESDHEIPMSIYWELDTWNDGWMEDEEEDKCVAPEQLRVYEFDKRKLYGICLGYYPIDLSLFESDIVPELIGILFDSTEEFCYVTSYEDEEKVYLYSAVELNEDNLFDIEEGLMKILEDISPKENKNYESLETYFSEINQK